MSITYSFTRKFSPLDLLHLLSVAGILHNGWTEERLKRAFESSSVVVSAWENEKLIGIARSITDFAWCAYLSQLAVLPEFQKKGIGSELIKLTREKLGPEVALIVHSVEAGEFYKKFGFKQHSDIYRLNRER